ncbi:MAG: photosynthetic complex assembly protein PuhC [Pseudomonadota bacterium]
MTANTSQRAQPEMRLSREAQSALEAPFITTGALYAACGIVTFSLIVTTLCATFGWQANIALPGQAETVVPIHIVIDETDQTIAINDARDATTLASLPLDVNYFTASLKRSLDKRRRYEGITSSAPFELVRWDTGRLSILDPATGKQIQLRAFGKKQHAIFTDIMERASQLKQASLQAAPSKDAHP